MIMMVSMVNMMAKMAKLMTSVAKMMVCMKRVILGNYGREQLILPRALLNSSLIMTMIPGEYGKDYGKYGNNDFIRPLASAPKLFESLY